MSNYQSTDRAAKYASVQRELSRAIRLNPQACWPVRNLTNRKWWQRAYQEPERWAMAQVHDRHTGELVRDIVFAPDGRIAIVSKRCRGHIYVREVSTPCPDWRLTSVRQELATGLPRQEEPCMLPPGEVPFQDWPCDNFEYSHAMMEIFRQAVRCVQYPQ